MNLEMFNFDQSNVPLLMSEVYAEGWNKMRNDKVKIDREIAKVKIKEAVIENQPQSVLKILLVLLFFSRTKVIDPKNASVEAEFGKTTSLIPGVENYIVIIVSILLSFLLGIISFWSVMCEARSKTIPFLGKLFLRNRSALIFKKNFFFNHFNK